MAPQVFLYDGVGSELYEWITLLDDDYYLTSRETQLICDHAHDMARPRNYSHGVLQQQVFVELGAGTGRKTQLLLRALLPCARETIYAPIDVSEEALRANVRACSAHWRAALSGNTLRVSPLVGDFAARLPDTCSIGDDDGGGGGGGGNMCRKVYLYLGSSLGNFSDAEGVALFSQARHM